MKYIKYCMAINQWLEFTTRSMFGGVGLFYKGAIFAQISNGKLILRGGEGLSIKINNLGCKQYKQIKKRTITSVDYFDVTQLYENQIELLRELVSESAMLAYNQKQREKVRKTPRIRELINLQFKIERMLCKVGINDCNTLQKVGAAYAFALLKKHYGSQISNQLLWKLSGAIEGIHWWLLQEPQKKFLLSQYQTISFELHPI